MVVVVVIVVVVVVTTTTTTMMAKTTIVILTMTVGMMISFHVCPLFTEGLSGFELSPSLLCPVE